jgi:hypothetical protein
LKLINSDISSSGTAHHIATSKLDLENNKIDILKDIAHKMNCNILL